MVFKSKMEFHPAEPHRHNYFPFQKQADFEPTDMTDDDDRVLYRRVEYMIMTCSCSAAVKSLVKVDDNETHI